MLSEVLGMYINIYIYITFKFIPESMRPYHLLYDIIHNGRWDPEKASHISSFELETFLGHVFYIGNAAKNIILFMSVPNLEEYYYNETCL